MAQVSLIDVFRRCSAKSQSLRLTASQRSLLYALMYEWNEANRQSTVHTTFTRLRELSMLPDSTLRDAVIRINESNIGFHIKRTKRRDGAALWYDDRDMPATNSRLNAPAKREQSVKEESLNSDSSATIERGTEHDRTSTTDLQELLR